MPALVLAACADHDVTAPPSTLAPSAAPALAVAAATDRPSLPQTYLNTTWVEPTGRRLVVSATGSLQAAIDSARGGDVILLRPGAQYKGNFKLRSKPAGTAWITIMTDTPLPAPGTRMTPAKAASLAKIVTGNQMAALATNLRAHHYRIVGVEITASGAYSSISNMLVSLGSGNSDQATRDDAPHHLTLDRVYVHGKPGLSMRRCVTLNSASTAVIDSYLSECHGNGEAQAIHGHNGPGPFKIVNNYLAGAGENVMFGGSTPPIAELIPSDIEIRGNHFHKPLEWKGVWVVKNVFELKCAQRVLVEGNVFENSWKAGQSGFAVVLKSEGPSSQSWIITRDLTFRYNIFRNVAGAFTLSANPGGYALPMRRVRIEHNLVDGVGTNNGTTLARSIQLLDDVRDVAVVHNTVIPNVSGGTVVPFDGTAPGSDLTVKDNVFIKGSYGLKGSGQVEGMTSLNHYYSSWSYDNNVQVGYSKSRYPASNFAPATTGDVGFVDYDGGNYRLAPTSPYVGKASDGTNPGADIDAVTAKTSGVVTPLNAP